LFFRQVDDVLLKKDVDLIFIVCPPYLHSQISVKALGIGKHVVCDRPAGLGQDDSRKMVRASLYYPSLISIVNHSLRFLPAVLLMKKAIADGYLGNSTVSDLSLIDIRVRCGTLLRDKFDWLCDATMGGGTLNLIGSHIIDLVTFLTGKRAARVHGLVRTYTKSTSHVHGIRQITAPDYSNFQLELENGILVTVSLFSHVSCASFTQEIIVSGTQGYLTIRGGDLIGHKVQNNEIKEEVLFLDVQDLHVTTSETLPKVYVKGLCKMVGALREAFLPVQEHAGWIKEPVVAAATFEDGLYVNCVLDAIRKSSSDRAWVKVEVNKDTDNQTKIKAAASKISAVALH
jgi:predicted dehydrogenase